MATSSMIPYSNPAGVNQTSPNSVIGSSGPGIGTGSPTLPVNNPLQPTQTAQQNPLIPVTGQPGITSSQITGAVPTSATPGTTSAGQGFITQGTDGSQNALQKQYNDIYGAGVGDSIYNLLNSMSGTNSTILQEYIQGLQPQEAQSQANLNASLGAGGVSANSSVAALGNSNLQAQEFASISNESANLTQNQENLTANILTGTEGAAAKEVASSGWDVLGSVLEDAGAVGADFLGLGGVSGISSAFGGSSKSSGGSAPYGPNSD